jgi:ppGpp synthetase/RelA/SpoT-type nucleotidyltranferase
MAWTEPKYSRSEVDRAGEWLVAHAGRLGEDVARWTEVWSIIHNWRSSHSYPLNAVKMTLRGRARRVYEEAIVAQRLKRFASIFVKLRRNRNMKLSQMQDIGGCRAILPNVRAVEEVVRLYDLAGQKNPHRGRPVLSKTFDYIHSPKPDGYRSYHLVYKYDTASPVRSTFNGHRIEIQIRSRLQHAWATAVETVDIATSQALKTSVGEERWKRFFALMGSAIALRERRPLVPGTPTDRKELANEVRQLAQDLNVEPILAGIGTALQVSTSGERDDAAFLLALEAEEGEKRVMITGYPRSDLARAQEEYADIERAFQGKPSAQAVLVSVDSLENLGAAYPNFFLDTRAFLDALQFTIGEKPTRRLGPAVRFKGPSDR